MKLLLILNLTMSCLIVKAQETLNTSGGDIMATGGTIHYSIGQVFYLTKGDTNSYQIQGVQQPYKISLTTGFDAQHITLITKVYPNPTSGTLTLLVADGNKKQSYTATIHNAMGKLLQKQALLSKETKLHLRDYPDGVYLLNVYNEKYTIKTFKIVKH